MHFIVTANYNNKTNCFEAHTHTYKTGKTMPKIIRIKDEHNSSKIHCYKFYSCGHVYYNQGYSCTEDAYRYSWKRLLKTIGHNGYRKYYNQAVEILRENT